MMIANVKGTIKCIPGDLTGHTTDASLSPIEAILDVSTLNTGEPQRDAHLKSDNFLGFMVTSDSSLHEKVRSKTFGSRIMSLLAVLTAPILAVSGCSGFWDLPVGTTASTVTLTASGTSVLVGTSVTLTATVSPTVATGTVSFFDGSTSLGTGTLSSGTARLSTTFAAGTHSVTATYGGNSTYASSTSSAVSIVSTTASSSVKYTTITVDASSTTLTAGEGVILTATLSDADATGKVRFYDASTSPVSLLGMATLDSGTATLPVTFTTAGMHQIMASYTGSSGYAVSSTEDALPIITDN